MGLSRYQRCAVPPQTACRCSSSNLSRLPPTRPFGVPAAGELVGQLMENWLNVVVPAVLASCETENMPTSCVPLEPLRVAVPIWFQLVPLVE